MQHATLDHALQAHRASHLDRPAVVCGTTRLGWAELDDRVGRLATWLLDQGAGPGARVAWLAQNCHRYLEALLACARVGATFAPLNWRGQTDELAFALTELAPVVVLWQAEELGDAVAAVRATGTAATATWIPHDAPDGLDAASAGVAATPPTDRAGEVPVLALFTAAFAGRPRASLLPESSLLVQGLYGMVFQGVGATDVYLNAGPLFHVGTLKATAATFLAGGTNVFVRRVDPEEICSVVSTERCTGAFLQPPTIDAIVELNRDGTYDLSSLRAKPGPEAWNAMVTVDHAAARFSSGYGQTELGGVVTFVDRAHPCLGSAGRPGPLAHVELLDQHGTPVPPGETGEIAVSGPMVQVGYLDEVRAGGAAAGGWHRTHDLGRREADGSITFIGPLTRLIKSAAENIYPAEVEACLRRHEQVADAAVIGVPDPTWGQRVVALVVPTDGAGAIDPSALIEHCRRSIASYKKPKEVRVVETIPRVGGAIDYDGLDAAHGGGGYPGTGPTASPGSAIERS